MITKKRIFKAIAIFILISLTPLYDTLFFFSKTRIIHGTIPPNTPIYAISYFYTESLLCHDFSLGTGSFLPSGSSRKRVETTSDINGHYELELSFKKNSFWCDWINQGADVSVVYKHTQKNSPGNILIAGISAGKDSRPKASSLPVNIECAETYYLDYDNGDQRGGKNPRIICRNTNLPSYENSIKMGESPSVYIFFEATELTLNMSMKQGPVYDFDKGPVGFWQEFDKAINSDSPNQTAITP